MANNRELGELGQYLSVNTSSNSVSITSTSLAVGSNTFTVGTSAYFVSNGNVGIGTSSPGASLEVSGGATNGLLRIGQLQFKDNSGSHISGTNGVHMFPFTDGMLYLDNYDGGFSFRTLSSSEKMRITSAGNVGIGRSDPSFKLDIYGGGIRSIDVGGGGYPEFIARGHPATNIGELGTLTNHDQTFITNSSEKMRLTSAGNVGIGTTTPDGKFTVNAGSITSFDVSNPSGYTLQLSHYITTTGASSVRKVLSGIQGLVGSSDISNYQGSLAFLTTPSAGSPTERMRITSAGYVGIGTSTPSYRLNIQSAEASELNRDFVIRAGDQTNYYRNSLVYNASASAIGPFPSQSGGLYWEHGGGYGTSGGFVIATNNTDAGPLIFGTNNTERMRITSTGNVGIGRSDPSFKLDIYGGGIRSIDVGGGGYPEFIARGHPATNIGELGTLTNHDQTFITNSSEKMRITGAGNVGIGKTNPSTALDVNGTITGTFKNFSIPHPLPELSETHNLLHTSIEAPTADNIYRGKVQLENGQATVNIDTHVGMTEGTFSALNGNLQVFLQNDSGWDLVRGSVSDNILTIISQNQSSTDTISWMVIGERQDQNALDAQWTDEFGRPILEPVREPEPDISLPEVSNENS